VEGEDPTGRDRPQDVLVFVVGGVTYEEGKLVAEMNVSLQGTRIVLGGTSVLNAEMFIKVRGEGIQD
jgi:vacuolar protein sorting-associated protein 45